MNSATITTNASTETIAQSVEQAHIEMLRNQNAELLERAEQMQRFIATFPALITKARLDAKEGKQTNYNYVIHEQTQRAL